MRELGAASRKSGILLTVHEENAAARAFYDARGLELSPISPVWDRVIVGVIVIVIARVN